MGKATAGPREVGASAWGRFRKWSLERRLAWAIAILVLGLLASVVTVMEQCGGVECVNSQSKVPPAGVAITGGAFVLSLIVFFVPVDNGERVAEGRERVREAERDLEQALRPVVVNPPGGLAVEGALGQTEEPEADLLPSKARLALSELWAVTHRRLDLYHEIATSQASRSFRNAQVAMVIGFVLLVAFVIVALQASTTAGAIVAGGLGAVAAGLAGYVSRTFVRSQESAASHLRAYFDQPLEFSRYLAAERLVADSNLSDEQRAEVVTELVKAMIAGPTPQAGDTANGSNGDAGNASA
ncbi:hypothetical protein ACFRLW_21140 [Streptomyces sp. NPDC056728]|uniref:hypothetical protein n=1 Tax=Paenibacillus chitinolyticus TaxID=79263 RepID=UPI00366B6457